METDPIKILLDRKICQSKLMPILKAIFSSTGRLVQQQNHHQIYPFICKVKRALKTRMAQSRRSCYLALIILQDYSRVDNYNYDLTRVKCRVVDEKVMPLQVECMIVLANGDIAIASGSYRFEICIYRHDLESCGTGSVGGGAQRE